MSTRRFRGLPYTAGKPPCQQTWTDDAFWVDRIPHAGHMLTTPTSLLSFVFKLYLLQSCHRFDGSVLGFA